MGELIWSHHGNYQQKPALAQPGEERGKADCLLQMGSVPLALMEEVEIEGSFSGCLWQGMRGQFTMVLGHLCMHNP